MAEEHSGRARDGNDFAIDFKKRIFRHVSFLRMK
jgi:hypothetical protein